MTLIWLGQRQGEQGQAWRPGAQGPSRRALLSWASCSPCRSLAPRAGVATSTGPSGGGGGGQPRPRAATWLPQGHAVGHRRTRAQPGRVPPWLPSCCPGPGPCGHPDPSLCSGASGSSPLAAYPPRPQGLARTLLTLSPLPSLTPEPRPFAPAAPAMGSGTHRMSGLAGAPGSLVRPPGGAGGGSGPSVAVLCASPPSQKPPGPDWGSALLPASLLCFLLPRADAAKSRSEV